MSLSARVSHALAVLRPKIAGFGRRQGLRVSAGMLCGVAAISGAAQTVQHLPGTNPVGTASGAQTVTITVQAAGLVSEVRVLTQGAANRDFTAASGGTCTTTLYTASQTCTVNVTVKPTAPGRRTGAVVLVDAAKHVLASQLIDAKATGPLAVIRPGTFTTVAGVGTDWRYRATDEGQPAASATIYLPQGVAADDTGVFYISDTINNRVRKVDLNGNITTYAGVGFNSSTGDGGRASNAGVSDPTGMTLDGAGNLYFADSGNNAIRRIDAASGIITTVAGQLATNGFAGDTGPATQASLANPNGVVIDADGNLFIADTGNNAVRRVDAATGVITTVAGGPTAVGPDGGPAVLASLNQPWSLAIGPTGLLYIADLTNNVVRQIAADNTIHTVAGVMGVAGFDGDGGPAINAHLKGPAALAVDAIGNLYIADSANNRIRRVDASNGNINTAVGAINAAVIDPDTVSLGNPGNSDQASLYGPYALALDGHANLYLADYFHNNIRKVASDSAWVPYATMRVGKTSEPQRQTIENDGNAALTPGISDFSQSALDAATTSCGTTLTTVAPAGTCVLGVQFAPTVVGTNIQGTLTFHSDGANAPDVIHLYDNVLTVEPTQTLLTSSANPAGLSAALTFTAAVTQTQANAVPTGTVTFLDGTTALGAAVTLSQGKATFTISTLALGAHNITAKYSGDSTSAAGVSTVLIQNIVQTTQLTLQSSLPTSSVLQDVTFTATLAANPLVTSGTITFLDGSVSIGTGTITANGTATFTTHDLTVGGHLISAKYAGSATSLASTSVVILQTVKPVASSTMLSANPSTATVGTSVTLTATVTSSGGPTPTGTVAFKSGITLLGTSTLDANGIAVLTTSAMAPGPNAVTATYSGDTPNLSSTSSSMTVTVNRLTTATTLASNTTTANAGSPLQLTASVSMVAGQTAVGTLTGTVTFYDGATVIGAQALTNGTATLSTSALGVGSHNLKAVFSGNTNFDTSTSTTLVQVVQTSSTTTQLSLSAASVVAGKPLTLTANVATTGTKATGTVTFSDGGTVLGNATLTAQAVGTLTLTTLPIGTHSIVVTYNGDSNYDTSVSAAAPATVTLGNSALTLLATPTRVTFGTAVTLNANLTTNGVFPANPSVTVKENGNTLTALTMNAQGTATFLTSTLSVGTHDIIASYAGDTNNAAVQSQTITVTIDASTTTTSLTSSKASAVFGDTVTLQSNVTSSGTGITGSVTFSDGSAVLGTAQLAGGVASVSISNFTVGSHTITAVYNADSTHSGSTSAALTQVVVAPTAVSLRSGTNPSVGGTAVQFTAQVVGTASNSGVTAAATGTVIFHEGASILGTVAVGANGVASLSTSSLTVGTHTIVATYSGDALYAGNDSVALTQTVRNASSQTSLAASANPAAYAATVALTVRVTGNGGAPTGIVTLLEGGASIGTATLISDGSAVLNISTLSPGIHALVASYAGDSNNSASISGVLNLQVQQTVQVTLASSSNPALTLDKPVLTATVRTATGSIATGSIRFQDGAVLLGNVALNNGAATLASNAFSAGSHALTATYSGDTANLQAVSSNLALQVNLRATQSTLTATAPSATTGILTLISVLKWDGPVAPTGVITFRTAASVIGTSRLDTNGVGTLNVQGTSITGNVISDYSGDTAYAASESVPVNIGTIAATNFTMTLSQSTVSVQTKKYVVGQVTIKSVNGFTDTLALGCLGLPYAATCTFDKNSIALTADGSVVVKVTFDTGSPLGAGGSAQVVSHTSATLALLPAGALLGMLLFGKRRRAVPVLLMLMLASLLLPTVGCGTIDIVSTPPGSYKVAISAVGQKSGVTLSQEMNVTVTP